MVAALSPWPLAAINIGRAEILLLMVLAGCRPAKAGDLPSTELIRQFWRCSKHSEKGM
jgi:hypothetical protein